MYKSIEFKDADVDTTKREITGYAATWDEDQVGDIITKGAFSKTLSERAARVKFMYNHKHLMGKPIEMYEDSVGLVTKSVVVESEQGDHVLKLAQMGALDEMSIQFTIPKGKSEFKDGLRFISEVKLFEFGPVDFPANSAARILDVKSLKQSLLDGQRYSLEEIEELSESLAQMKALVTGEAATGTSYDKQPQDLKALQDAILNFGAFARN